MKRKNKYKRERNLLLAREEEDTRSDYIYTEFKIVVVSRDDVK